MLLAWGNLHLPSVTSYYSSSLPIHLTQIQEDAIHKTPRSHLHDFKPAGKARVGEKRAGFGPVRLSCQLGLSLGPAAIRCAVKHLLTTACNLAPPRLLHCTQPLTPGQFAGHNLPLPRPDQGLVSWHHQDLLDVTSI